MKKLNFAVKFFVVAVALVSVVSCSSVFKHKSQLLIQSGKSATYDGKSSLKVSQAPIQAAALANKNNKPVLNADFFKALQAKQIEKNLMTTVSFHDKNGKSETATVEIVSAKVEKSAVSYSIKLVNGKMPKEMRDVTLTVENYHGSINK